jgi:hypothetical protein
MARRIRTDAELLVELKADRAWTEPRQARLDALGADILLSSEARHGVNLTPDEFDRLLALAEKGTT